MSLATVELTSNNFLPPPLSEEFQKLDSEWQKPAELELDKFVACKILGEGQFGVVKLKYNSDRQGEYVAVKILNTRKNVRMYRKVATEMCFLFLLRRHPNIVSILGHSGNSGLDQYEIYMEYCDGGELFDRIEPDVGMSLDYGRFLFRQLLDGIEYIHAKGIVHRDIKPENLLLTSKEVLKICDFGLAAVYKHDDVERFLKQACGSPEYAAPEVVAMRYRGPPVDLWSAGVTLLVCLTGVMPWEKAQRFDANYSKFADGETGGEPFCHLDIETLAFIKFVLNPNGEQRPTLDKIKTHRWLAEDSDRKSPLCATTIANQGIMTVTQPATSLTSVFDNSLSQFQRVFDNSDDCAKNAFSQPWDRDSVLLSQVVGASQADVFHPLQSFTRRMTRFCTQTPMDELITHIEDVCRQLGFSTAVHGSHEIMVKSMFSRRSVDFLVQIFEMSQNKLLVDARRSRGLGLDFKHCYRAFRSAIEPLVCSESDNWLRDVGLIPNTQRSHK